MTFQVIAYLSVVTFVAAAFRGIAGVGFSLIFAPLALLIIDARSTVILSLFSSAVSCLFLMPVIWRQVDKQLITPLVLFSLIGSPLGVAVYYGVETYVLKIFISVIVIAVSVLLLTGKKWSVKNGKWDMILVGLGSGILGTSTSLSGPVVILYLINKGVEKESFRASTTAYFFVTALPSMVMLFLADGKIPWVQLFDGLKLIPAMLAGLIAGTAVFKLVSSEMITRLILILLIVTGLLNLFPN